MGYKAVKDHYDIKHIVAVYDKERYGGPCICIGSPYCHDLIVIRIKDAKIVKPYPKADYYVNDDLARYNEALLKDEENGTLRRLIETPDTFTASLPVYTIKNWLVVAEFCEIYGWPNVTHTGNIMYENTYFKSREEAYAYLLRDTTSGVRYCNFRDNFREGFNRMKRTTKHSLKVLLFWIAARTVGRFKIVNDATHRR